jgi:hypothetical protein
MVTLHLLALIAVFAVPLAVWMQVVICALVLLSLAYRLWVLGLRKAPWSLREAQWAEQGWRLGFQDGSRLEATLLPSSLVTSRLVILNFRVHRLRYHSLLLTEQVIVPDLLRRLRARLRLEHGAL